MTGPSANRLTRMLAMVPYFLHRNGISQEEAARDLGITRRQLVADLNALWVCGLPNGYGGDLIDLDFEGETVSVWFTAGIDRPLRLTRAEAAPLLIALQSLIALPGTVDADAARRVVAKLEGAIGGAPPVVSASDHRRPERPAIAAVRGAVRDRRALRLTYYSASRDAISERVVDPVAVRVFDEAGYLLAWCRASEGTRLFRFDRIEDAQALAEPSAPPREALAEAESEISALFGAQTGPDGRPVVELEVDREYEWLLDYDLRHAEIVDAGIDGGPIRVRLVFGSTEWLTRLVLGAGGRVRPVGDAELASRVAERAAAALAQY